jgi:hypothetical protein
MGEVVPDLKRCGAIHTWFEWFRIGIVPTPALPNAILRHGVDFPMGWVYFPCGRDFTSDTRQHTPIQTKPKGSFGSTGLISPGK